MPEVLKTSPKNRNRIRKVEDATGDVSYKISLIMMIMTSGYDSVKKKVDQKYKGFVDNLRNHDHKELFSEMTSLQKRLSSVRSKVAAKAQSSIPS